jgi:hypothetical protein
MEQNRAEVGQKCEKEQIGENPSVRQPIFTPKKQRPSDQPNSQILTSEKFVAFLAYTDNCLSGDERPGDFPYL